MNHPLTRIFVPISMIVFVAATSVMLGLDDAVISADATVVSEMSGATEVPVLAASRTESQLQ